MVTRAVVHSNIPAHQPTLHGHTRRWIVDTVRLSVLSRYCREMYVFRYSMCYSQSGNTIWQLLSNTCAGARCGAGGVRAVKWSPVSSQAVGRKMAPG